MGIFSSATIVNNSLSFLHRFPTTSDCQYPCFSHSFSSVQNASGIGDITLRVKGNAWEGERAGFGFGVDVRVPTGDQLNFLGAGAAGVRPFFVVSSRGKASLHALVGFEVNGSSVVAGDILTGSKERLPSQLTYSGGTDVRLAKWLTAAFDLVGQQVFEARRMSLSNFPELGACQDGFCGECPVPPNPPGTTCSPNFDSPNIDKNLSAVTGSYNITNASVGAKIRPGAGGLVITVNAKIKLNHGGLRDKVSPFVALSYNF